MKSLILLIFSGMLLQQIHSQVVVPGEWQAHNAVWIALPGTRGGAYYNSTTISIIRKLAGHVHTKIVVEDLSLMAEGKVLFHEFGIDTAQITLVHISPISPWLRDIGPVFYHSGSHGEQVNACDFRFTSYENSPDERIPFSSRKLDEAGRRIAETLGSPLKASELVLEGGAFEVNGNGTIILVDSLILNRNPSWSKAQVEEELAAKLGIKHFIWLEQGLAQDPYGSRYYGNGVYSTGAGGHTDHFVRFANDSTILLHWEPDTLLETDPLRKLNNQRMTENLEIMEKATDHRGKSFHVIKIPSPGMFYEYKPINKALRAGLPELSGFEGSDTIRTAICASYLNCFMTNGLVLLPAYDLKTDEEVRSIFQKLFPEREIYQVNPTLYNKRSGGIHCLIVQQPAGPSQ